MWGPDQTTDTGTDGIDAGTKGANNGTVSIETCTDSDNTILRVLRVLAVLTLLSVLVGI